MPVWLLLCKAFSRFPCHWMIYLVVLLSTVWFVLAVHHRRKTWCGTFLSRFHWGIRLIYGQTSSGWQTSHNDFVYIPCNVYFFSTVSKKIFLVWLLPAWVFHQFFKAIWCQFVMYVVHSVNGFKDQILEERLVKFITNKPQIWYISYIDTMKPSSKAERF